MCMQCLQKGLVNRVTGSTNMNNVRATNALVSEVGTYIRIHTHTYIYIYIYIYSVVIVKLCVCVFQVSSRSHAVLEVVCVNEPADAPAEGEGPSSDDMGTDES